MTDFRLFPYVFGDVVTAVRTEYDPANSLQPVYEFGTYLELTKRIAIKDRNIAAGQVDVKYPLVWLVWEANENQETWTHKSKYSVSPRIFICTGTDSNYRSAQRYDDNFIGIMFPIWELMKTEIEKESHIGSFTSDNFTKSDHLYWGESIGIAKEKNVLFDTLDAIEIKFDELKISKINC